MTITNLLDCLFLRKIIDWVTVQCSLFHGLLAPYANNLDPITMWKTDKNGLKHYICTQVAQMHYHLKFRVNSKRNKIWGETRLSEET